MNKLPKVSVVVPVYNVEKYVEECLNSILCQSLYDIEVICVNDGSTDRSPELLRSLQKQDDRIMIVSKDNKGQGNARNVGIRLAQGEYICFIDSDDMLEKDALEKLYNTSQEDALQVLSFETKLKYENDKFRNETLEKYYTKINKYPGIMSGRQLFEEMISNEEYCDSACLLFINRKWLLEQKINFPEGVIYEDVMFPLLCFLKAEKMRHLSIPLYIYRIRDKSTMTSPMNVKNLFSRLRNLEDLLSALFSIPDKYASLRNAIIKYIILIHGSIQAIDFVRMDKEVRCDGSLMTHLMKLFTDVDNVRSKCSPDVIIAGIEKIMADSNGVILYGAGIVGKNVYKFAKLKGIENKIKCFAVTGEPDNDYLYDKPIVKLSDLKEKEGLIFICVKDAYHDEMKRNLMNMGINKYIVMDVYTRTIIKHYIEDMQNMI